MDIAEALQLVLSLARDNILDPREDLDESVKQKQACDMVEDFIVNQLGDE